MYPGTGQVFQVFGLSTNKILLPSTAHKLLVQDFTLLSSRYLSNSLRLGVRGKEILLFFKDIKIILYIW